MKNKKTNDDLIADLKALIAFIKANKDFDFMQGDQVPMEFGFRLWYVESGEIHKAVMADLAKRLGSVKKSYNDDFIILDRMFGSTIKFHVAAERSDVCERVIVGTEIIPAHGEIVIPAAPERLKEIVEWKCSSILAPEESVSA